jgi:energy-coupling factor transporter ATP-binding protein EcfA2
VPKQIIIKNLSLRFNDREIFYDVNARFTSGEVNQIKGANGSGKTSLLRCICGAIPTHFPGELSGEIIYPNGDKPKPYEFGFLMQEPEKQICFPYINEELCWGAENLHRNRVAFQQDFEMITELFPILKKTEIETHSLSFGEKKALLFAGIILRDPPYILLDEPTAGLSTDYRAKFKTLIDILVHKDKIIIIAEHENYYDDIYDMIYEL